MPAWFRLLFYASAGVAAEVAFTAVGAKLGLRPTPDMDDPGARRSLRLKGHSFVWMFPIYGLGLLYGFEPLHVAIGSWPLAARGAVYVAAVFAAELAAGVITKVLAREHVWRWQGRDAVGGHVKLSMAPAWLALGIAAERLHDVMR